MHSVILHFLEPREKLIELANSIRIHNGSCESNSGEIFLFWDYDDYDLEYDDVEKKELEKKLGNRPECSFQLLSRNKSANFALKKVIELFKLSFGVMDDDKEKLWTLKELIEKYNINNKVTLYNLDSPI